MGLVSIHSFLLKRMTAVAEEIFDVVKGSITEYEQEIERLKQENCCLRNTLSQSRVCSRAEAHHDTPMPEGEVTQAPLASDISEIRVKMEVAAVPMSNASTSTSPISEEYKWCEPHHYQSNLPNVLLRNEENLGIDTQSSVTVKSEQSDNQDNHSYSAAVEVCIDSQTEYPAPQQDPTSFPLYTETSNETRPKAGGQRQQNILFCRFCRRLFRTRGRLQKHLLVHKNDVYLWNSAPSGSRFKSKIHLKPQERLNTERQAETNWTGELAGSQRSHHVETNQRNSDKLSSSDQQHGNYPFYCKVCDRPFRRQKSMQNHMLLHQDERNYACQFCGRKFHKSWHLAEHLRIHTGEKPFGCSECGKRFVQWNQARSHIIKHHEGNMSLLTKA